MSCYTRQYQQFKSIGTLDLAPPSASYRHSQSGSIYKPAIFKVGKSEGKELSLGILTGCVELDGSSPRRARPLSLTLYRFDIIHKISSSLSICVWWDIIEYNIVYLLTHAGIFLALTCPGFFLSTLLGSRVTHPATEYVSENFTCREGSC